jgi:hypothetical protein
MCFLYYFMRIQDYRVNSKFRTIQDNSSGKLMKPPVINSEEYYKTDINRSGKYGDPFGKKLEKSNNQRGNGQHHKTGFSPVPYIDTANQRDEVKKKTGSGDQNDHLFRFSPFR